MNTVWQSLLWKEWHENRWKLASLTVILFAVPICMSWGNPQFLSGVAMGISVWYSLIAPIYIAAGVCASEASGDTLPFLQATPVDRRQWALAKLAMGWLTLTIPLLLLLSFGVIRDMIDPEIFGLRFREELNGHAFLGGHLPYFGQVCWFALCAIAAPASMFIWSLAAGVNCRRELWAIARSVIGLIGLCIFLGLGAHSLGIRSQLAQAILPGGFLMGYASVNLPVLLVATIFYAGLLAWYLTQFGRSTRYAGHSPKAAVVHDPASVTLRKPHRSKTSAILWVQMQEIAPLALASIAMAFLTAGLLALNPAFYVGSYLHKLGAALVSTSSSMGFFFAILIGVGVFLRDLEPGLNTFWRSRPIPASEWFWTKFLSAYAMLMMSLAIPTLLAWSLSSISPIEAVFFAIVLLTAAYTTAVAVTVMVRHAIYGCVISMGMVLIPFLMAIGAYDWDSGDNEVFYRVEGAVQITLIVVTTLIAWLAVTRDWGWKR